MFKKILVTLDGSPLAEEVVSKATELALLCDSQVILLQVIPPARPALGAGEFYLSAEYYAPYVGTAMMEEAIKRQEEQARTYLEWTAGPMRERGLDMECVTLRGVPADEIIRYANDNGVDLVAIATHGRGGVKRLVLGSVTDKVVRGSGLPILLISPKGGRPVAVEASAAKRDLMQEQSQTK